MATLATDLVKVTLEYPNGLTFRGKAVTLRQTMESRMIPVGVYGEMYTPPLRHSIRQLIEMEVIEDANFTLQEKIYKPSTSLAIPTYWRCEYCQHVNSPDDLSCPHCGAVMTFNYQRQ